ncbi:hypothetical protein RZS08_53800, partial [Arthrospira platensis SPKY1]|nr:hypothetical protein [Arthrospira platensis SPKY1]
QALEPLRPGRECAKRLDGEAHHGRHVLGREAFLQHEVALGLKDDRRGQIEGDMRAVGQLLELVQHLLKGHVVAPPVRRHDAHRPADVPEPGAAHRVRGALDRPAADAENRRIVRAVD